MLLNVQNTAELFKVLAHPTRVQIVLAIAEAEACVCHLEAVLGLRQAYLSQHLMALRQAGVLRDRREGRFVFYRLANVALLTLVTDAARVSGDALPTSVAIAGAVVCSCPVCEVN